jgi:hypothetical protein
LLLQGRPVSRTHHAARALRHELARRKRDNKEKRLDWVLRGFRQFDAPVLLRDLLRSEGFAVGRKHMTTLMRRFGHHGAVPQAEHKQTSAGAHNLPVPAAHAGDHALEPRPGDDQVIQACIAMGWPNDSFPANVVVSHRKSADEAVVFVGFDE